LFFCEDFHLGILVSCSIASCRVGEAPRFAPVSRRSKAGRFAYNLRVPRWPISRHADTAYFLVAALPRYRIRGLFENSEFGVQVQLSAWLQTKIWQYAGPERYKSRSALFRKR
jgi:hypothetical protein